MVLSLQYSLQYSFPIIIVGFLFKDPPNEGFTNFNKNYQQLTHTIIQHSQQEIGTTSMNVANAISKAPVRTRFD